MTTTHKYSPSRALSALAACLVLVVGLLGPLGVAAPTAHADSIDDAFLAALRSGGISYTSPAAAIAAHHAACAELDEGKQPIQVAYDVMNYTNMDAFHAGYFVGCCIGAYCPSYASQVEL